MKKQSEQKRRISLARRAYAALLHTSSGLGRAVEKVAKLERENERKHRSFGEDFRKYHPHAASVTVCAEAMTVHNIAGFMLKERVKWPQGADLLTMRYASLLACGIADEHGAEIRKLWTEAGIDVDDVCLLDYIVLVSPENKDAL
jgi:hypothetical protein